MAKKKRHGINLRQYRKVDDRWQWVQVSQKNERPDPKYVHVGDKLVPSKGGTFFLDWRDESGARRARKVGTNPTEALDAWKLQIGIKRGDIEPDPDDVPKPAENKGKTIDQAVKDYLVEVEATKGAKTLVQYRRELTWFQSICTKKYVSELDRSDAMALFAAGRKVRSEGDEALNQKTINRRAIIMLNAMRSQGATITMKKGDWPKTVDKQVEIYEPEELPPFFAACTPKERLIFLVFLATGFREQEVSYLWWPDIDAKNCRMSVTAKSGDGFLPKSYEERSVRVPRKLMDDLLAYQRTARKSEIVFPTDAHPTRRFEGGKHQGDFLSMCKAVAFRAELNCGHCEGEHTVYVMREGVSRKVKRPYCCATGPYCAKWYLHKFRHTFATKMVQDGADIRTLQVLLGHKNIATTEKYLKSLRLDKLADLVESGSIAALI